MTPIMMRFGTETETQCQWTYGMAVNVSMRPTVGAWGPGYDGRNATDHGTLCPKRPTEPALRRRPKSVGQGVNRHSIVIPEHIPARRTRIGRIGHGAG